MNSVSRLLAEWAAGEILRITRWKYDAILRRKDGQEQKVTLQDADALLDVIDPLRTQKTGTWSQSAATLAATPT